MQIWSLKGVNVVISQKLLLPFMGLPKSLSYGAPRAELRYELAFIVRNEKPLNYHREI